MMNDEVKKSAVPSSKGSGQLSSSLKERLKRCGRYYSSPITAKTVSGSPELGFPLTPDSRTPLSSKSVNRATPCLPNTSSPNDSTPLETCPSSLLTPTSTTFQSSPSSRPSSDGAESLSFTPVLRRKDLHDKQDLRNPKAKRMCLKSPSSTSLKYTVPSTAPTTGSCEIEAHCAEQTVTANDNNRNVAVLTETANEISNSPTINSVDDDKPQCGSTASQKDCKPLLVGNGDSIMTADCDSAQSSTSLLERKAKLLKTMKVKEECLRKLRMVKMYRSKNNLSSLNRLITKWTSVSQQVLLDLHSKLPEPRPGLAHLLTHLQIDFSFIKFNPEDESFE